MLESLFRLLFNYRPVIFQQGEFRLVPSTGSYVAAAVVGRRHCGDVPDVSRREVEERDAASRRARGDADGHPAARALLPLPAGPRRQGGGAAAELPRRPDRRLAQHADRRLEPGSRARLRRARTFATPDAGAAEGALGSLRLRTFRFSSTASRVGAPSDLTFAGAQTRIGAALDGARQELAGLPLAGLVVVSDGADTTDASLTDALLAMKAASVPVFTVGVGTRVAREGRAGRSRVGAARGAQGHLAHDRRRRDADRVRGRDGDARRRGRRTDRRLAGGEAAGRRRAGGGARAIHRRPKRARGCSSSGSRRGPARSSRRTTSARR